MTRDVPGFALVGWDPARQAGWACRCGEVLRTEAPPADFSVRFDLRLQPLRQPLSTRARCYVPCNGWCQGLHDTVAAAFACIGLDWDAGDGQPKSRRPRPS